MSKDFWNERYSSIDYIYGKEPNRFFSEQLNKLKPGRLLLLGEGEGRNAVYAASKGWEVDAIDQSEEAKRKALKLAKEKGININYNVLDVEDFQFPGNYYDAVSMIFFHIPKNIQNKIYPALIQSLKMGGIIILESFGKEQINFNSGGPKDPNLLVSDEEISRSFRELNTILLENKIEKLVEGAYHSGEADVVRFVGIKN